MVKQSSYDIRIFSDIATMANAAAEQVASLIKKVVGERGVFHWALAGGRTPMTLYRILATAPYAHLPWGQIHIWFGDERAVPGDHPDSNFRMARESLLDHISIPDHQVHPMPANLSYLRQGAWSYAQSLQFWLPQRNGVSCLDLIMLGIGTDGHIASLFPGSCALHRNDQTVVATYAPGPQTWRITFTRSVINHAHQVILLVTGTDKAATVARALSARTALPLLPIQRLLPQGEMTWYMDTAAAALLSTSNLP